MNFDTNHDRKGSYCTQWDFTQDRFGKSDLLPFTISDMDFSTAEAVQNKLAQVIQKGIFGYSRWAHSDYYQAITGWYWSRFQCEISSNWISYSPNVIYGLVRCLEICNPSQKPTLVFTPCYDGFVKILSSNGFPMRSFVMASPHKALDEEKFSQSVRGCAVLLLCNPNNPNGHLWNSQDLQTIVRVCKAQGVWIISDDIHMDFTYAPHRFCPIFLAAEQEDYLERCIIISSASKTFNASALGGAYVLIPNTQIKEIFLSRLRDKDSLSSPMILGMHTLITGYTECAPWVDELCVYCQSNLAYINRMLENSPLSSPIPDATYFAWIDAQNLGVSQDELQQRLIEKGKVAIMRGDVYQEPRNFLRLNAAASRQKIEKGVEALFNSIDDLIV